MKPRLFAIAAAAVLALALVGAAATPWIVTRYAESEVDQALAQVRKRSTAVASRGDVVVDIWSSTVTVRDLAVDTPGNDGAKVRVGKIVVERPGKKDGRVTAARVRFDDIVVTFATETMRVPSIDVVGYDGPAEGLVGTPGAGKAARTQADIIGQVSADSGTIPSIEIANGRLGAVRTVADVAFARMTDGEISRATIGSVGLNLPVKAAGGEATTSAISLTTGALSYEALSVPAILRFQAGDGEGDRERLVAHASAADIAFEAPTETLGPVKLKVARVEADDIDIRALAAPAGAIQAMETKAQRSEPLTPAEMRQQILFLTDAFRAFGLAKVHATGVAFEAAPPGKPVLSAGAERFDLVNYADGRLGGVGFGGGRIAYANASATMSEAVVAKIDASGLLAYAERVGLDKALLTTAPPPDEMLKLFPRLVGVRLQGVETDTRSGRMTIGSVRTGARGEADEVPNRVALIIENLSAPVPKDRWFSPYFADAGLERLNFGARMVLSLDPTTKILKLDGLDYASPDVADIHLAGSLSKVDPSLAISSGGDLVSKLFDVTLQPFTLRVTDHGGLAAAYALAAKGEGAAPKAFVEAFAQTAETRLAAVLGPSADASATALGLFLRTGGTLEAKITPRTPDTPLLDLIGLVKLGPEGIAQALDVTIVSRTE